MLRDIVFSCSGGGHYYELKQLLRGVETQNCYFITEKSSSKIVVQEMLYSVPYDSGQRRIWSMFCAIYGSVLAIYLAVRFRPRLHVSLGSHVSVAPTIVLWFLGIPTVHIESFTRVNDLSKSGKVIYKFAQQFYVQWPALTVAYSRSIFKGSLF